MRRKAHEHDSALVPPLQTRERVQNLSSLIIDAVISGSLPRILDLGGDADYWQFDLPSRVEISLLNIEAKPFADPRFHVVQGDARGNLCVRLTTGRLRPFPAR